MNQVLVNSRLRVREQAVISLKRHLPQAKGTILVNVGQEVSPGDVLGEGQTASGFRTVHLAKELGVSPKEAVFYLKRKIGQIIYQGELLAAKDQLFGLKKKLLLSPADGVVEFYDTQRGDLKLKLQPKMVKLVSGVYGIIEGVDKTTGQVLVKTLADVIYGIFGCGKEREGMLKILGSKEMLISSKQLTEGLRGQIVVGGGLIFKDALEKAVSLGVEAIISGGINSEDYKSMSGGNWNLFPHHWSDIGFTLMVTEGFGGASIGADIFPVLAKHNQQFSIIDGNRARLVLPIQTSDCMMYIRKVNLPVGFGTESLPEVIAVELKVGMKVRLIVHPFLGELGEVVAVDSNPTTLPSSVVTTMVTVATSSKKLRLPYQNLEICQ